MALFGALLAARLCHVRLVWTEEAYPAAAAIQMLAGKTLYRDIWYDKPPLAAVVYLAWGAHTGLWLRVAGAVYLALTCWLVWKLARDVWGEREAWTATGLLAFFFVFDIPAAVTVLGPDLLMTAPQVLAVWLAWRKKAFWSGAAAGVAFLVNTKGLLVLVVCAVFDPRGVAAMALGFAAPNAVAAAVLAGEGALAAYWDQVWRWGFIYARDTPFAHPLREGLRRTLDWAGFHAALVIGAAAYLGRRGETAREKMAWWLGVSLAGVAGGWRFFPRYYFQALPAAVVAGARGLSRMGRWRWLAVAALAVPLVRFGPRYAMLASDALHGRAPDWSDVKLSQDAVDAGEIVKKAARPGDTLLVWGYRPEVFAVTRMKAASRFLDSQPLTGVIADRHLTSTKNSAPEWAAANRKELAGAAPAWIVDGLGPLNPALAIGRFEDLREWFSHYREVGRTGAAVIYRREK